MEKVKNKNIKFFVLLFLVLFPFSLHAASLSIIPSNATYSVGDRITIKIGISGDKPLNAVSGTIIFPKSIFTIESVSKSGSILNFWVTEPFFSNTSGEVKFEGVSLSGFNGGSSSVLTVNLRAVKEGIGDVVFESGQILANDGLGTDITSGLNKGTFTITKAKEVVEEKKEEPIKEEVKEDTVVDVQKDLDAPKIRIGKQDGVLAVLGTSNYPRSNVLLTFISKNNSKVFISGQTDDNGNFSMIVPQALRDGTYSVSAVVVKDSGDKSQKSEEVIVEIGWSFKWLLLSLPLVLLFRGGLKRIVNPKNKKNINLGKKIEEADSTVHKSFKLLKEDLKDTDIDISDIKKDMEEAEKIIEKEIEEIEDANIEETK